MLRKELYGSFHSPIAASKLSSIDAIGDIANRLTGEHSAEELGSKFRPSVSFCSRRAKETTANEEHYSWIKECFVYRRWVDRDKEVFSHV